MNILEMRQRYAAGFTTIALTLFAGQVSIAQESDSSGSSVIDALTTEEVVVTATKKAGGEAIQDVPIAITAFGEEQLDAFQLRDISGLSFKMPNVALDEIGTTKGVANFTIRGLGVNSSIPSIDPAVGVFVDGVYLGMNAGVIFDTFDLESVETLRGPQGVLFGRNVTGGAVLLNTSDPTDELRIKAKIAADSGLRGTGGNYYAQGVISGPIQAGVLSAKFGIYANDDGGWFENTIPGAVTRKEDFGESDTYVIRGALKFTPTDTLEVIAKYEHGDSEGEGPAAQSHTNGLGIPGQIVNFSRDSFDFAVDEVGFTDAEWDSVSAEINLDVGFGNGTITNIFGWREFIQFARSDIDARPAFLFHANVATDQNQISNEIRYNGTFFEERLNFTAGFYYFHQELDYGEQRDLLGGALTQDGGGTQDHETIGVFLQGEYQLTDRWSLNAGIRYNDEEKDVEIASLVRNVNSPCTVVEGDSRSPTMCPIDFRDSFSTSNWAPKVGLGFEATDDLRFYAHWARSFRAGGFNFRNTAIDTVNFGPGPFEDEQIDSFEIGFKSEPFIPGARVNGAFFYNFLEDLQREINLADPFAGVVQVIRNTAEAEIWGVELDAVIPITDHLVLNMGIGYIEGDYEELDFDLNGDGMIDAVDLALDIPRLAPLTGNIGFTYARMIQGMGEMVLNFNYAHRDGAAYTDNNLGTLNEQDRIDASASTDLFNTGAKFTIYGKNLTNEVLHGNDTQLPAVLGPVPTGGTFAPLLRGRQVGIELQYVY
ncbi:MAG: TonB-dependent receptor [Pseudomonadota bacterium]